MYSLSSLSGWCSREGINDWALFFCSTAGGTQNCSPVPPPSDGVREFRGDRREEGADPPVTDPPPGSAPALWVLDRDPMEVAAEVLHGLVSDTNRAYFPGCCGGGGGRLWWCGEEEWCQGELVVVVVVVVV